MKRLPIFLTDDFAFIFSWMGLLTSFFFFYDLIGGLISFRFFCLKWGGIKRPLFQENKQSIFAHRYFTPEIINVSIYHKYVNISNCYQL